jgi:hypoxanthine phosphoribosyltransferase
VDSTGSSRPQFSHSAEEIFARILDFYGIEWQYEPRTFALAWDDKGNVTEAFRPDFYLPQQDLYIELTTLRPRLSTYKNRKLRRMKELYPDVNIKLFKRREMRDLMVKYGLMTEAQHLQGTGAQPQKPEQAQQPEQAEQTATQDGAEQQP